MLGRRKGDGGGVSDMRRGGDVSEEISTLRCIVKCRMEPCYLLNGQCTATLIQILQDMLVGSYRCRRALQEEVRVRKANLNPWQHKRKLRREMMRKRELAFWRCLHEDELMFREVRMKAKNVAVIPERARHT